MQTTVKIPESYRDYATDRTIQSVVDHLLDQEDDSLPAEIDWDDVRAYHQAWLSAQKVKTDYVLLLMDLWDVIWQPVLNKYNIKRRFAINRMKDEDAHPARDIVWDDGKFYCWFDFPTKKQLFKIYTAVAIHGKIVKIHLCILDSDDSVCFFEDSLSSSWKVDDENENNFFTRDDVSIEKSVIDVDVSRLISLADEAISSFVKYSDES